MLQLPSHRWSMTRAAKTSCEKLTTPLWPATSAEEAVDFGPIPRELEWEIDWMKTPSSYCSRSWAQTSGKAGFQRQVAYHDEKCVCIALGSTCGHKLVKLSTYWIAFYCVGVGSSPVCRTYRADWLMDSASFSWSTFTTLFAWIASRGARMTLQRPDALSTGPYNKEAFEIALTEWALSIFPSPGTILSRSHILFLILTKCWKRLLYKPHFING